MYPKIDNFANFSYGYFQVHLIEFFQLQKVLRKKVSPRQSYNRVRTGPGKPGKSWNFILAFSRTGKSWKKATGPGKFWKSVKLN